MVFHPISSFIPKTSKKDTESPFPYIFLTFNADGKLITMGDKTEIYKGNYLIVVIVESSMGLALPEPTMFPWKCGLSMS